jgi:hypothetical protein
VSYDHLADYAAERQAFIAAVDEFDRKIHREIHRGRPEPMTDAERFICKTQDYLITGEWDL